MFAQTHYESFRPPCPWGPHKSFAFVGSGSKRRQGRGAAPRCLAFLLKLFFAPIASKKSVIQVSFCKKRGLNSPRNFYYKRLAIFLCANRQTLFLDSEAQEKALQKERVSELSRSAERDEGSAPRPRKLLKKLDQNFQNKFVRTPRENSPMGQCEL